MPVKAKARENVFALERDAGRGEQESMKEQTFSTLSLLLLCAQHTHYEGTTCHQLLDLARPTLDLGTKKQNITMSHDRMYVCVQQIIVTDGPSQIIVDREKQPIHHPSPSHTIVTDHRHRSSSYINDRHRASSPSQIKSSQIIVDRNKNNQPHHPSSSHMIVTDRRSSSIIATYR